MKYIGLLALIVIGFSLFSYLIYNNILLRYFVIAILFFTVIMFKEKFVSMLRDLKGETK